jgi:hypothetical protein
MVKVKLILLTHEILVSPNLVAGCSSEAVNALEL